MLHLIGDNLDDNSKRLMDYELCLVPNVFFLCLVPNVFPCDEKSEK